MRQSSLICIVQTSPIGLPTRKPYRSPQESLVLLGPKSFTHANNTYVPLSTIMYHIYIILYPYHSLSTCAILCLIPIWFCFHRELPKLRQRWLRLWLSHRRWSIAVVFGRRHGGAMQHFAPQPGGHVFDQRQGPSQNLGRAMRCLSRAVKYCTWGLFGLRYRQLESTNELFFKKNETAVRTALSCPMILK